MGDDDNNDDDHDDRNLFICKITGVRRVLLYPYISA